ncbi:MAG: hypothetical protein ACC653_13110 [Gammaproteobacteria bacterium]
MLRKNKDNYLVLILFAISITMLFTICSSEQMNLAVSNTITHQNILPSKIETTHKISVSSVSLPEF